MSTAQQLELEKKRHSLAHILAFAVKRLYPDVKIGIGPVTDTGFYYEFDSPQKFNHEDLEQIQEEMHKIIEENLPFVNLVIPREQAEQTLLQLGETYKSELLSKIPDQEVHFYKTGDEFIDLCRGPHVKSTGELNNFKLTRITTGHWLNDPSRPSMQKIEGIAFESKTKLDDYLANSKKLEEINSIDIATRLGIIEHLREEVSVNAPVYRAAGILLKRQLIGFIQDQLLTTETELLEVPPSQAAPKILPETLNKFISEGSFDINTMDFLLERITLAKTEARSSFATIGNSVSTTDKEKPKSFAEFASKTCALVLTSTNIDELPKEIEQELKLIGKVLKVLGFNQFKAILEVPNYQQLENYLYDESSWDHAISIFKNIITEFKLPSKIKEGGAEFFGPKLSIVVKDKFLREWPVASLVIDLMLVREIGLKPTTEDSPKLALLHTRLVESFERLYDLLLEHTEGQLPLWLAPTQVHVVSLATNYNHKVIRVERELRQAGFRVSADMGSEKPETRIAQALAMSYPYVVIIGEKEASTDALSIKTSSGQELGLMRITEFIEKLKTEMQEELAD